MDGEEGAVLDAVAGSGAFLVLAPRHPQRFEAAAAALTARGLAFVRRSRLDAAPPAPEVLLLDTIGELGRAYALAAFAFVGGSLVPTGGHNPLEPAVWRVPVLTGPHVHNFREVYDDLAAAGAARVVADGSELGEAVRAWLAQPETAHAAGEAAWRVVEGNRGATARTVEALLGLAGGP